MNKLNQKEINQISGGLDTIAISAAVGGSVLGAGFQWYRGAGLLSSQSMMWALGGAALGAAGYYGTEYVLNYMSE